MEASIRRANVCWSNRVIEKVTHYPFRFFRALDKPAMRGFKLLIQPDRGIVRGYGDQFCAV